jgi:hypothetical protein
MCIKPQAMASSDQASHEKFVATLSSLYDDARVFQYGTTPFFEGLVSQVCVDDLTERAFFYQWTKRTGFEPIWPLTCEPKCISSGSGWNPYLQQCKHMPSLAWVQLIPPSLMWWSTPQLDLDDLLGVLFDCEHDPARREWLLYTHGYTSVSVLHLQQVQNCSAWKYRRKAATRNTQGAWVKLLRDRERDRRLLRHGGLSIYARLLRRAAMAVLGRDLFDPWLLKRCLPALLWHTACMPDLKIQVDALGLDLTELDLTRIPTLHRRTASALPACTSPLHVANAHTLGAGPHPLTRDGTPATYTRMFPAECLVVCLLQSQPLAWLCGDRYQALTRHVHMAPGEARDDVMRAAKELACARGGTDLWHHMVAQFQLPDHACAVCYESFVSPRHGYHCQHHVCEPCQKEWDKKRAQCPVCRAKPRKAIN